MSGGRSKNGCLVGLLIVSGIVLFLIAIMIIVFVVKGEDIRDSILDQVGLGVVAVLSDAHTPQERDAFAEVFSDFISRLKSEGIRQGAQHHNEAIIELQTILDDQTITPEESAHWIETFRQIRHED